MYPRLPNKRAASQVLYFKILLNRQKERIFVYERCCVGVR